MFCKNCGKPLSDDSKFCTACGTSLLEDTPATDAEQPATEVLENSAPVTEETASVAEEPATEVLKEESAPAEETTTSADATPAADATAPAENTNAAFAQPGFSPIVKRPNKKLKALVISAIALVTAGALVAVALLTPLKGMLIKTFGSDLDYFKYVETKSFSESSDDIAELYGKVLNNTFKSNTAAEATIKLNVGDSAVKLLETITNYDLKWLQNLSFDTSVNSKDNVSRVLSALKIGDTSVIDLDYILDMNTNELLLGLPMLNSKYFSSPVSDDDSTQSINLLTDEEYKKLIPTEKELSSLLNKYSKLAIDNVQNVQKRTEVLRVNDMAQDVTVLEVAFDSYTAQNVSRQILLALRQDEQIKTYIYDTSNYLMGKGLIDDANQPYLEYQDTINEALEEVEYISFDADETIILVDYVNSKHEIIGRQIRMGNEVLSTYYTLHDGTKTATLLNAEGLSIVGNGTDRNGLISGTYNVNFDGDDVVTVGITNFDTEADDLNGEFSFAPSIELVEEFKDDLEYNYDLDSSTIAALSIVNPKLVLNFENSGKKSQTDVNLVLNDAVFLGFSITAKETKATNVTKPAANNVCSVDDSDEWLETADFSKIINNLKTANVPTEIVEILEYFIQYMDY